MVKGTELSIAIVPNTLSRFQLCEIRQYDIEGNADRYYAVRDAQTVSDMQVAEGIRPSIVAFFNKFEDALAFCRPNIMIGDAEQTELDRLAERN